MLAGYGGNFSPDDIQCTIAGEQQSWCGCRKRWPLTVRFMDGTSVVVLYSNEWYRQLDIERIAGRR